MRRLLTDCGFRGFMCRCFTRRFCPHQLPPRSRIPTHRSRITETRTWAKIGVLRQFTETAPNLLPEVRGTVDMPNRKFANGQAAFKVGTRLGEFDLSASYYYGRHDIPTPVEVTTTTKSMPMGMEPGLLLRFGGAPDLS